MAAQPIKSLELHYTMIQILINSDSSEAKHERIKATLVDEHFKDQ